MLKRTLTAAMLTTALVGSFAITTLAQDQSGQTMQSEKKMGETMMKNDDKMMKSHKSKRKAKKDKAHKKAMMKDNKMSGHDKM
jgi:hypothetical protein